MTEPLQKPMVRPLGNLLRRVSRFGPLSTLLAICILGGIILLGLHKATEGMSVEGLVTALRSIRVTALLAALGATLTSFVVLTGYDYLGLRYEGSRLPLPTLMLASFASYSIGNAVGLGTLTGGAVRYRIYSAAGLTPVQIGRIIGFISLAFGFGAFAVTCTGIELRAFEIGGLIEVSPWLLRAGAGAGLAIVLGLLFRWATERTPLRAAGVEIKAPSTGLIVAQLILAAADVLTGATVLWILLPSSQIDFLTFAAIYAAALMLGVLSHVPGGLGVFEVVILYALGGSAPATAVAAALLAYRTIYFLVPLLIGIVLLAAFEARHSLPAGFGPRRRTG